MPAAMQRPQLEHIIRAAAGITGADQFVIVGSQAVLGQFPQAPEELLASMEADLFTLRDPADSDLIDGSIGEGSPFHQTFGYYAHGVGAETAVLPAGWNQRLVPVKNENTGGGAGLCLEVHDLAVSKCSPDESVRKGLPLRSSISAWFLMMNERVRRTRKSRMIR